MQQGTEKPIASLSVIYDGDCPFCSNYVGHLRLREVAKNIRYLNARDGGEEVSEAVRKGFDLDDGMLVTIDGTYYYGSEAMRVLADLSSPSGLLNRLSARLLKSPTLSRLIYPVLRFGRNITLLILGRGKIALKS
jgi:predicted DCC family thiol-disulfide oxidoreductase YuxK